MPCSFGHSDFLVPSRSGRSAPRLLSGLGTLTLDLLNYIFEQIGGEYGHVCRWLVHWLFLSLGLDEGVIFLMHTELLYECNVFYAR